MKRLTVLGIFLLTLLTITSATAFSLFPEATTQPSYAKAGSYAYYDTIGGFIPFFDGVSGNISYRVTNVFNNGSMAVTLSANMTQGNEVPESQVVYNFTESISAPKIFPAVPVSDFSKSSFAFENTTCTLVKNGTATVPAGKFDTLEYSGVNGTSYKVLYWFDRNTGLVIQMAGSGAAMELVSSNIATPIAQPQGLSVTLPYILVFVVTWVVAAAAYLGLKRYYDSKSKKPVGERISQR